MICVSYTRMTTCNMFEEVSEDIISVQNKRIAEYAAKRKWKIMKKYSDRKSDRDEDTAFRNLKEDGISQKFDCVIFDSLYRFGTSVYVAFDVLFKTFCPGGIHFASVEDDFCSLDYTDEEVREFLNAKRAEYKKLRHDETVRRYVETRQYNKYGYLYIDDTMELVIDEEVADNIRTVFKLMSEGLKPKKIATIMNERGIEPPNSYLKRMGTNRRWTTQKGWLASQVSNISMNRMYAGVLSRTINSEKVNVPCPAIVSEELFDKVQAIHKSKQNGTRTQTKPTDNPLSWIFFDYDSGWNILRYKSQSNGEDVCKLRYPKPKELNYPKMSIPYSVVITEIQRLLYNERDKAQEARRRLNTPECRNYKKDRLEEVRMKAQAVFKRMTDAEYSAWQNGARLSDEEFQKNDAELQALITQHKKFDFMLSENNPWIRLFADLELPENMTSREMRKYIVRATCEKFETVRIEIKERDAFLALPQEWFSEV